MKDSNSDVKNIFQAKLEDALLELQSPAIDETSKLIKKYSQKLAKEYADLLEKEEKRRMKKAEKLYRKEIKKAEKERIKAIKEQLFENIPNHGDEKSDAGVEEPSEKEGVIITQSTPGKTLSKRLARRRTARKPTPKGSPDNATESLNS